MRDSKGVVAVLVLVALLLAGQLTVSLLRWQEDKDAACEFQVQYLGPENLDGNLERAGRNGWRIVGSRWAKTGGSDYDPRFSYEMIMQRCQ